MDWNVMKVGSMLTSRWSLTGSGWNQIRSRVFSAASGWWHSMRFGHQMKVFQQSETWHKNVIFIYIYIYYCLTYKSTAVSHTFRLGQEQKTENKKCELSLKNICRSNAKSNKPYREGGEKKYEKQIAALLPRLWHFGEPMEWAELACKGVTENK